MEHYDSAWKEAIRQHFRDFLEICFPAVAAEVDWDYPVEPLNTELDKMTPQSLAGRRRADALMRVRLLTGQDLVTLIHTEVQGQKDTDFLDRLAQYHWRILDNYSGSRVCTLVVLADTDPEWYPTSYQNSLLGCTLRLDFPVCKLLRLPGYPVRADSPVSWLIAGHRQAQATAGKPELRKAAKWRLVRGLYSTGLDGEQIRAFYRLLDWVLVLPPNMSYDFQAELTRYEEELQVAYITTAERIGREKGLEEGRKEGLRRALTETVLERWGVNVADRLATLPEARLVSLVRVAATADSFESWRLELEVSD